MAMAMDPEMDLEMILEMYLETGTPRPDLVEVPGVLLRDRVMELSRHLGQRQDRNPPDRAPVLTSLESLNREAPQPPLPEQPRDLAATAQARLPATSIPMDLGK